jgi:hypothetical protein
MLDGRERPTNPPANLEIGNNEVAAFAATLITANTEPYVCPAVEFLSGSWSGGYRGQPASSV